ncbi:hypothetical protein, conserved [Leishmania tarentolae]|uniref:Trypanosoma Tc-38 (p38) protein domain-containing protein n=1 Tax=Leishmania tarentolae TaxID=5689 RepID=A0A640KGA0_LEITA|nr:hypothetical protein, conserved [Leishmania tarentolae]
MFSIAVWRSHTCLLSRGFCRCAGTGTVLYALLGRRMRTHDYLHAQPTCFHPLRERKGEHEAFFLCKVGAVVVDDSMLQRTHRVLVVFTQGFPALQRFAQRHFLPSHPLSSSCLWLDEEDFRINKEKAFMHDVPNPLRIDPYAHHPLLSRYAPEQARGTATQRKQRRKAEDDTQKRYDRASTGPVAACCAGPQAANNADAMAPGHLRDVADAAAVGQGAPSGPMPTADYLGAETEHSLEATLQTRRRRKPSLSTAAAAKQAAVDVQHYQVPICTLTLTKPLFLFNMDQMYLADGGAAISSLDAHRLGREGVDEYDRQHDMAIGTCPPRNWSFDGDDGQHAQEAGLPRPWDGLTPMTSEGAPPTHSREQRIAEGIRDLQRCFPNLASDPSSLGRWRMHSIRTRRPYSLPRQHALSILAHRHGYRSQWWGTLRQWSNIGVLPQPGHTEHVLPISVPSKIVHISLIEDAAAVLQRCIISAKRGKLMYVFASSAEGGFPEFGDDVMGAAHGMTHPRQPMGFLSHLGERTNYRSEPDTFSRTLMKALEDMRVNKWSLPVYFTARQLRTRQLKLRSDAVGILQASARAGDALCIWDGTEAVEAWNGELSAADREAATAVTPPTTIENADAALSGTQGGRAPPCDYEAISTIQSMKTSARGSAGMLEYWYHISQVYFPDSYLVPSVVLTAEFENPDVPLNGVSGERLPYPTLLYESLVNQHPEVAAVVRRPPAEDAEHGTAGVDLKLPNSSWEHSSSADAQGAALAQEDLNGNQNTASQSASAVADTSGSSEKKVDEDLAIARFVATHSSPKHTQGRSLWYKARDVLAAGGVVDVNSAPVEVMQNPDAPWMGRREADGSGHPQRCSTDKTPGNALYNVEWLINPDEALRLISTPFEPI